MSDPLGITAQPVGTWLGTHRGALFDEINMLIRRLDVTKIIVGYPLTMKGQEGVMAREVKKFVHELQHQMELPVELWDERLSSVQAKRFMRLSGLKSSRDKKRVDRIASCLILQSYLDHQKASSISSNGEET